jgi:hypothetical protein
MFPCLEIFLSLSLCHGYLFPYGTNGSETSSTIKLKITQKIPLEQKRQELVSFDCLIHNSDAATPLRSKTKLPSKMIEERLVDIGIVCVLGRLFYCNSIDIKNFGYS